MLVMASAALAEPGAVSTTTTNAVAKEAQPGTPSLEGLPDSDDYKIAPLDTLQVRVFLEDTLTGEYKVAASGSVTLPLLKRVEVVGLTANQAEERIEKLLGQDFLVEPQVSVTVKSYRKRSVTILGEVKQGTSIELPAEQKMDIMEAISRAGGFTEKADKQSIKVTRDGKQLILRLDKLLKAGGENIYSLQPGDVIYIPQRFF